MGRDDTLRLALLVVFPVIGFEQIAHTPPAALVGLPVYQALHWLSDSLLALPLAATAVWGGHALARRLRHGQPVGSDLLLQAAAIGLVFAVALVPGAALHEEADQLTHAHARLSIRSHAQADVLSLGNLAGFVRFVEHAAADGVESQVIGLPLILLALIARARTRQATELT